MTVTPSALVLDRRAQDVELHTCLPAEVVRVQTGDHARQFVDVLPALQRRAVNEDGETVDEKLPVIPMVPVAYPQGGGFFISVPLAVGDVVLLVFAERSIDSWIQTAKKNSQRAVLPGDVGMHPLDGAIALPCGPAPRAELLHDVDGSNLVIGKDGGAQIHITPGGQVCLGSASPGDHVALASKVADQLTALKDAISSAVPVPMDGGAALQAAILAALSSWPESVASSNVKAD
jgi:hypothetical protein